MLTTSNDSRLPCLRFYFGFTRPVNQYPQKKRKQKSTTHLPMQQLNHHSYMVLYHMVKDIQENSSNNPGSSKFREYVSLYCCHITFS